MSVHGAFSYVVKLLVAENAWSEELWISCILRTTNGDGEASCCMHFIYFFPNEQIKGAHYRRCMACWLMV
jgi:hypothetical protein